nr:MAG TPA: protein of unknown function (DUF4373) [Caudoviricetes sp.]
MCMCSDRYFRHDIHASLDLKLRRLMAVHGAEGYGNYWLIIELLSQLSADEGKEPRMQFDEYYVAALIHTKKYSMIWSIIHDFDLFVIEMGDDDREYFYSRRLFRDFHEGVIKKSHTEEEPSDEPTTYRSKRQLSPEARERMAKGGRKYRPTKVESKVEEGSEEGSTKVKEGTEEGKSKVESKVKEGTTKVESKVEEGSEEGSTKVKEGTEEGKSKVESKVKEGTTKVESKVEEGSEEGKSKVDPQKSKVNGGDNRGGKAPKTIRQEDIKREGEKATRFSPPSLDEVRDEVERLGYAVDPERFIAHYESNGWRVGPNKMKSWKSALVTWHKRQKEEDAKRQSLLPRASQSRPTYTNAEYHPERSAPPSTPQDEMAKWLALDHDNRAVLKRNFPEKYANYPD